MVTTIPKLQIRDRFIEPPLFLAPMAGVTHSAFRRLVADFGGYGALYTEMLSGTALLGESLPHSPFTKRRSCEGNVIYQLRLTGTEPIPSVIERLRSIDPWGIDINLGCPAPEIRSKGGGTALFEDFPRLQRVLEEARNAWDGPLTVKCRLGTPQPGWEERLEKRIALFESIGIDALAVHPRFSNEKLKRSARWSLFPKIVSLTRLPLIANGDIESLTVCKTLLSEKKCSGIMIGRMAVVQPWIFRTLNGDEPQIDYREHYFRLFDYVCEDFPAEKAIGRIKEFSTYYARNFFFGHELYRTIQSAHNLTTLRSRAESFFGREQQLAKKPSVAGI